MKSRILFVLPVILLLVCCNKTDIQYWDNGSVKSQMYFRNGEMHGTSVWYYENGNKQMEVNYRRGELHGISQRWYINGEPQSFENYVDNLKNGSSITWDEAGEKILEETFIRDTLHGIYTSWYPYGQIKVQGYYDMGKYDSTWKYWNDLGLVVGKGTYKNGSGIHLEFYPNGKTKRKVEYQNNQRHGKEIIYNETGEPMMIIEYKNGEISNETIIP